MKTQYAFTSAFVLAALLSIPGAAQTADNQTSEITQAPSRAEILQPASQQAVLQNAQPVTRQIDNAIIRDFVLQTEDQPLQARPDRPRIMAINWGQMREDFQAQSRLANSEFSTAAIALVQRFPRPENEDAAEVVNTRLPVLMPTIEALQLGDSPRTRLFPRENFYTLSIRGPRILIEVFGTRLAHAEAPDARSQRQLRASASRDYDLTRTEYGLEINFNRYGAAYSITIECDNPLSDVRCREPNYGRRIAETLVIAAGTPAEGEL